MQATAAPIRFAGSTLGRYRHVCAFFNTPKDEYRTLLPFIRDGLERGERAFHVVDPESRAPHLARLREAGIDVAAAQGSGQLEVRLPHETYLRGGCFDKDAMLALIQEVLQGGLDRGFSLTRLVAHAECVLDDWPGSDDWVEYEARLNHVLPRYDDPVICTYDLHRLDAATAMDVMRTHPVVIVGGVLQENPFFVPPDEFLRERKGAPAGVGRGPVIHVAELPDSAAETKRLRACLRDLVALSTTPVWWIGRPPAAIAESLRDLLVSMLRADVAYVRIRDADSGECLVAAVGADPAEVEAALERTAGSGDLPTLPPRGGAGVRLASVPVGLDGGRGRIAVGVERSGFPDEIESLLLQVGASQVAVALEHAALLARHERVERLMAAQAAEQAAVAWLGLRALTGLAPARLLQEVVETVRDALKVDFCTVLEVADGEESLLLKAGAGWEPGVVGRARVSAGSGSQAGYTLLVSQPVVVADLERETRFTASPLLREHGVASGMSVLILGHDAPFGVLDAHTRAARVFGRDDVHFLQSVANLVATALQRHRAEAEREELLARTLAAQEEAERAARSKSDFLAVMSHELRTPLGTISGYVDLLEMGVHGPLTDNQHDDLARIRRCQQFLLSLINNVLAYMKLGSGHVSYDVTSVSMGDLAASVEELIRPQMDARHLRYVRRVPGGDLRVRADRGKLEQIVLNLLSNATKFTEPGGSVELECAAEAGTVGIRVRDSGCGIPHEQLERVFDPYVQVEGAAPRRAAEGTGLGLAISRDLARGMGGDIRVESRLGEGSTFTVLLPLDMEPAPQPPAPVDPVPGRS